jgi:hypothetical protein
LLNRLAWLGFATVRWPTAATVASSAAHTAPTLFTASVGIRQAVGTPLLPPVARHLPHARQLPRALARSAAAAMSQRQAKADSVYESLHHSLVSAAYVYIVDHCHPATDSTRCRLHRLSRRRCSIRATVSSSWAASTRTVRGTGNGALMRTPLRECGYTACRTVRSV